MSNFFDEDENYNKNYNARQEQSRLLGENGQRKLLTIEEICQYFDVKHIKALMEYTNTKHKILHKPIISKPLSEAVDQPAERYSLEDVEALRISINENYNNNTVTIPIELYNQLINKNNQINE